MDGGWILYPASTAEPVMPPRPQPQEPQPYYRMTLAEREAVARALGDIVGRVVGLDRWEVVGSGPATPSWIFNRGFSVAGSVVDLAIATGTNLGGVTVPASAGLVLDASGALRLDIASAADVATGTTNARAVTPQGLRAELGAAAATLATTAKTIVPAINEVRALAAAGGGGGIDLPTADARYLQLAGGALTGALTVLPPAAPGHPATRAYVDAQIATIPPPGIGDAPTDGRTYGRSNAVWIEVATGTGGIPDAPADGGFYARRNTAWEAFTPGSGGIADAPADGTLYGRRDAQWIAVPAAGGGLDEPAANLLYLRLDGGVMAGGLDMDSQPLTGLPAPASGSDAATKDYVDANAGAGGIVDAPSDGALYGRRDAGWVIVPASGLTEPDADLLYLRLDGGTLAGTLMLAGDPQTALEAATKGYVDANAGAGGIVDAPSDGTLYGRKDAGWDVVPASGLDEPAADLLYARLDGATMTGGLDMSGERLTGLPDPSASDEAATKGYVDAELAALQAGLPDAPSDGTLYGRKDAAWEPVTSGGGLEEPDADLLYVRRDGTTNMSSPLRIEHTDAAVIYLDQVTAGPAIHNQWAVGVDYTGNLTGSGPGFAVARLDTGGMLIDCPLVINDADGTINVLSPGIQMNGNIVAGLPLPSAAQTTAATPKAYVDGLIALQVLKAGDTMLGPLLLAASPATGREAADKDYVDGRVARAGDVMQGDLDMASHRIRAVAPPQADEDVATKAYVDQLVSQLANYKGLWRLPENLPPLDQMPPHANGDYYIITAGPDGGTPPPGMGLGSNPLANGTWVLWNDQWQTWQILSGSFLTQVSADNRYVRLDGGNDVTGYLVFEPDRSLGFAFGHIGGAAVYERNNAARDMILRRSASGDVYLMDNAGGNVSRVLSEMAGDANYLRRDGSTTMNAPLLLWRADANQDLDPQPYLGLARDSRIFHSQLGTHLRRDLVNQPFLIEDNDGSNRQALIGETDIQVKIQTFVAANALSQAQADTRYLRLDGASAMTGMLRFANTRLGLLFSSNALIYDDSNIGLILRMQPGNPGVFIEDSSGSLATRQRIATLADLAALDLTPYALLDGSRRFTGSVQMATGTGIVWPDPGNGAVLHANTTGLVLRQPQGNPGVFIENNNGASRSRVLDIDTADGRYLPIAGHSFLSTTGGQMTGDVLMLRADNNPDASGQPTISFGRGAAIYWQPGNGLILRRGGTAGEDIWVVDSDGGNPSQVIDQRRGDARYAMRSEGGSQYLPTTGGRMEGNIRLTRADNNADHASQPALFFGREAGIAWIGMVGLCIARGQAGEDVFVMDNSGANRSPVLTEARGDARYERLGSGGGNLKADGSVSPTVVMHVGPHTVAEEPLGWAGQYGGMLYDVSVNAPANPGATVLRQGMPDGGLYTESNAGANRRRILTEDDLAPFAALLSRVERLEARMARH